jgi:hypothetical protein
MANREKETALKPQITVVVLNLIQQLIVESKKTTREVIVIDQSDIYTYNSLLQLFPKLHNFHLYHQDEKNICKYLNFGWKIAISPIILFLDDDTELTTDTISSHITSYEQNSTLAVAGRVINDHEKIILNPHVGSITWYGAAMSMNFNYNKQTFVDFPYGCNMSFRKNTLQELGGFDESYTPPGFAYMEVDLGYRLNKRWPKSFVFNPDAMVYHHKHSTGGTRDNYLAKIIFQSNQFNYGYFLGKNFSFIENVICLLRRLPYQLIKEPAAIPSIIKGYISSHATRGESSRKIGVL